MTHELPYAYGGPPLHGTLRATPEDFFVDEELGFAPEGSGEHVLIRVEKRGANTDWVARELAKFAGIDPFAVSYSGMKDRRAVTRQTFSLHLPGKVDPDWNQLQRDEFRVLESTRHNRKLKRGAHKRNLFKIILRGVAGDRTKADQVIESIARRGVPNYFGEQRFGRDSANVDRAMAMFAGRRVQRHERSLLLSAARSHVFNLLLAERVARGNWNSPLDGDVWMLDGTHSIFGPEALTAELRERCERGDIHPTGPLVGTGELRTQQDAAAIESAVVAQNGKLVDGLALAGLKQERRSLVLMPQEVATEWLADDVLSLAFGLNSGMYATALIREICQT
jgi:tRNA pseudouridine13 synthase